MLTVKLVVVVVKRLCRLKVEQTLEAHKIFGIHPFVVLHDDLQHDVCVKTRTVLAQFER